MRATHPTQSSAQWKGILPGAAKRSGRLLTTARFIVCWRGILGIYLLLFLLLFLIPTTGLSASTFTFVQLADTQLGFTNGNDDLAIDIEHFNTAIKMVNAIKPDFVIINGDLVNEAHSIQQTRAFWRVAKTLNPDIPLHLVAGNHDLGKTTAQDLAHYRKLFGADYYKFSYKKCDFIILNSCLLFEPTADPGAKADQRKWFDDTMASVQNRNPNHIFVLSHHPWFLESPDEADKYENVPIVERTYYLEAFKQAKIRYALAGHLHRNTIARTDDFTIIGTGAISKNLDESRPGFRVFTVTGDSVEHHYVELP